MFVCGFVRMPLFEHVGSFSSHSFQSSNMASEEFVVAILQMLCERSSTCCACSASALRHVCECSFMGLWVVGLWGCEECSVAGV